MTASARRRGRGLDASTWRRPARIVDFGDFLLVIGRLSHDERERLSLTYVEQHRHRGGIAWMPKEAPNAS